MDAILVVNCGSSSVKFAVITHAERRTIVRGLAECLGSRTAVITVTYQGQKYQQSIAHADHAQALSAIVNILESHHEYDITAVGHRVVHGGERFAASCVIDSDVLAAITSCSVLAPLHNPANIAGIVAAQAVYPKLPQVAVFDTAFHQTLPETAFLYAIPYEYYQRYGIRRYGFHGTSFRSIKQSISHYYQGQIPEKMIVAHLGNGASVCAIQQGQSIATSMGLTPLDGLVQGTRSGSIDPAIIDFLAAKTARSVTTITDELWKKSGLLGLSGVSNDYRELAAKAEGGDTGCQRALAVFIARLQETIGSYAALMNGVDVIVFTGGIGENAVWLRQQTFKQLSYLGFSIDADKNRQYIAGQSGNIAQDNSPAVWVIATDEEGMIAADTIKLTA